MVEVVIIIAVVEGSSVVVVVVGGSNCSLGTNDLTHPIFLLGPWSHQPWHILLKAIGNIHSIQHWPTHQTRDILDQSPRSNMLSGIFLHFKFLLDRSGNGNHSLGNVIHAKLQYVMRCIHGGIQRFISTIILVDTDELHWSGTPTLKRILFLMAFPNLHPDWFLCQELCGLSMP